MAQTAKIVDTLKKTLKLHGLTYRDVAAGLGLSEATIKRIFAERSFTLGRLDRICRMMDMEIADLFNIMAAEKHSLSELTEVQEQELAADIKLLLVAFLVVNGWTADEILSAHDLSESELVRYLVRLDRLQLIELLPANRYKLLIAPNFAWRRNGPIQKFFTRHLQEEFFKSRFDRRGEFFVFFSGMLSRSSADALIKKMKALAREFNELNHQDKALPLGERFGSSMIVAIRPWRPRVFDQIRRK